MRVEDLNAKELLELDPDAGLIRFAGQRAVLVDAVAMGHLRKYLIENFGVVAARSVLTQFGFAHGWRMAEAAQAQFSWETTEELQRAGLRLQTLQGLFRAEPGGKHASSKEGAVLAGSYEAEQHLLQFGRTSASACWTICGLTSGFLSRSTGTEVYVLEDRCVGKGDAVCHLFGRTREEWGNERAGDLRFFESTRLADCLDVSLRSVMEALKVAERKLGQHRRALVKIVPEMDHPLGLVANSIGMRTVLDLAQRVAKVDSSVLITGESGSGKERIARVVHDASARIAAPFIAVNCGAITESLLESEPFGHARGAFTGATQDRAGLFEAANTGTLLLDEVGEVSPGMQIKLLRVLQEREVRRVGENKVRQVDVRVVAATNRDLAAAVADGSFRQELYYRLKVIELHVPALRERKEDILPLARLLLLEASARLKRRLSSLSPAAADQLVRYPWPGNVRELQNAMERAVALARGSRVELEDLPEEVRERTTRSRPPSSGDVRPLSEIERDYIVEALRRNDGNQARTAAQLHIGTATLYRKLKSYAALKAAD